MPTDATDPDLRTPAAVLAELRLARMLSDAACEAVAVVDAGNRLVAVNAAAVRVFGAQGTCLAPETWPDESFLHITAALTAARQGERVEFLAHDPQAPSRLYRHEMAPAAGDAACVIWTARDVSVEAAQAQTLAATQRRLETTLRSETLLARELHHRVRNLFSVISGLIAASQRSQPEGEDVQATLERLKLRILAMGRAADLLMPSQDREKPLINPDPATLSSAVLQPFDGLFRVSGIGPEVSTPMLSTIVLVLHEMASNSLEHGVLRKKSGLIDLNWRDEGSYSRLVWREADASAAARDGVEGRRLLRSLILASASEMHLCDQTQGIRAEFRFRNDWGQ